jgi:hypothetical protein
MHSSCFTTSCLEKLLPLDVLALNSTTTKKLPVAIPIKQCFSNCGTDINTDTKAACQRHKLCIRNGNFTVETIFIYNQIQSNLTHTYHIGFLSYLPVCRTCIWKERKIPNLHTQNFYNNTRTFWVMPWTSHTAPRFGISFPPAGFFLVLLSDSAVGYLVEALCYKPEGRGFDSRWSHWIF